MKKIFIILIYIVSYCGILYSAKSDEENLIPRKILFTGEQRTVFKLSPDGSKLYFSNSNSNSISYCEISEPDKITEIKMRMGMTIWEPVSSGLLTIVQDSTAKIELQKSDGSNENITLPVIARNASIVTKNRQNHDLFVLSVNAADSKESGFYSLDIKTKIFKKLYEPMPGITPFFDDNFNLIAGNSNNDLGGISINIYNKNDNSWNELIKHEFAEDIFLGGFSKILSVSSDGKTVWFTSNKDSDKTKLFAYNTDSQKSEMIAEHSQVDLLPMGVSIGIYGNVSSILGLFAKTIRIVTDPSMKDDFEYLERNISGDISFGGQSQDGTKWLIREFTGGPAKYYLYDRNEKKLSYLLNDFPALDDYKMANRKAFSVTTRDGLNLPVHIYLPDGSDKNNDGIPDSPLPTILYVHGGPWVGIVHWNQYFHWRNFQLLANRGYAVINCEFRGTTGLGKEFTAKSNKTWGTDMTNDKADIAAWAVENNIAKKDKVGIWGWSYGGYAAFAGLAFHPDAYACGISMYGISDIESFGKIGFANNDFWKTRVGDPFDDDEAKMLRDFSPINYIDKIKSPLLLTTGSKDERIPQQQMDSMASVLKNAGKDVIYFYYPEEVHDYRSPQSWMSFWAVGEQFLAGILGGRYEKKNNDITDSDMVVVEGKKFIEEMN